MYVHSSHIHTTEVYPPSRSVLLYKTIFALNLILIYRKASLYRTVFKLTALHFRKSP